MRNQRPSAPPWRVVPLSFAALAVIACDTTPVPDESSAQAVGPGPDWVVRAIDAPPSADGPFTAQLTACNDGDAYAPATSIDLYASADTTIVGGPPPGGDDLVGSAWVDGLDVGACQTVEASLWGAPIQGAAYLGAIIDPFDSIPEASEANNTFLGPLMGFGYGPDLRVEAIAAPPSAQGNFTAQVTVCNRGTAYTSYANVELYASVDTTLDLGPPPMGDPLIGSEQVYALMPGQCSLVTVFAWAPPIPESAAFLAAAVDTFDKVSELIETNNSFIGPLTGFGYGPDLVVSSVSAPPSADGPFTAQVRVCNQGTSYARGTQIELYASEDETLVMGMPPAGDPPIGAAWVDGLDAGLCNDVTVAAYAPPIPGSAAYVAAFIDAYDGVPELIESNNTRFGPLMGFGYGPDLIVSAIDAPPSADGGFDASVTVCNQGTAPAYGAEVMLVASSDDVVDVGPPPAGDPFVGYAWVPSIDPGQCSAVSVSAWAPPLQGAAYLSAIVDEGNVTLELIETNNTRLGPLMGFGYGPDLVVTDIEAPPSVDGPFELRLTVCNQGTGDAYGASVDVFGSEDTVLTLQPPPAGDPYVAAGPVDPLPAGACTLVTLQAWTPPLNATAGYLIARVDAYDSVPELIESNNDAVSELIGLGFGPDAIVAAIDAPPSADGPFVAQVSVCNQGTAPLSGTQVELFASNDQALSMAPYPAGDFIIGSQPVGPLDAGQCVLVSVNAWSPPIATGAAYLIAVVDGLNGLPELIESNNVLVGPLTGFGYGPDLVVSNIAAPPSASADFDVHVTVCNQGTAPTPSTELELSASIDTTINPGPSTDPIIGVAPVPNLAAGACQVVNVQAWPPPIQGAAYLAARVDPWSSVPELIESNNTTLGALTGFGYGPDLVVDVLVADPYVFPGGQLHVSYTVCNQGTDASPSTELGLLAAGTPNAAVGPGVPYYPTWIPSLAAGACASGTELIGVPLHEGPAYLVATLDPWDNVSELIESNNSASDPFEVAVTFCGNGVLDLEEACDDGNFDSGDGCSASCATEYHAVWQENAHGTLRTNINWNYAMGYHFTPQVDGYVTAIGGYFNGIKMVRLFDRTTGGLLAQTTVSAQNNWGYGDISAVPVYAGQRYTVAVYLAGSGGSYRTGVQTLPRTYGDVRIDGTTYASTGGNPNARPTNTVTSAMYGQADVRFSRYP